MKITLEIPDETQMMTCVCVDPKNKYRRILAAELKDGNVIDVKGRKVIEKRPYHKRAEETR
jgi:hypothetical protein